MDLIPVFKENGCGCFTLRTASMVIGWYLLISNIFIFLTLFTMQITMIRESMAQEDVDQRTTYVYLTPMLLIVLIRGVLLFLTVTLLKGILESSPKLMEPMLALKAIGTVVDVIGAIFILTFQGLKFFIPEAIRMCFTSYMLLILYSYYRALLEQ